MVFVVETPSPAAGLLQYARLKAGLSQTALAERAGVPRTMVSAYERDQRQPTLPTLINLLRAAGYDLRLRLEPYDNHDDVLRQIDERRSPADRSAWDHHQTQRVVQARARDERARRTTAARG
jgi:transcriptional regulator with XRE-family HTH domain